MIPIVLVYSIYGTSAQRTKAALLLTGEIDVPVISTQVLKEFTNVSLKKKLIKTTEELKNHLIKIQQSFIVMEITPGIIFDAIDLKDEYHYSFYDSLIIATAIENNCSTLLSEDLQHRQTIRKKLKIINPFK